MQQTLLMTAFLLAIAAISAAPTARAAPILANFDGYPEGPCAPFGGSFVESNSGITFGLGVYNLGTATFLIDFADTFTLPPVLPGNYLTGGGYGPGPGPGLGGGFGFTASFPVPSDHVDFDMLYSAMSTGPLHLTGRDVHGLILAQSFVTVPFQTNAGGPVLTHITFNPGLLIQKVTVDPGAMSAGYDNISIPEPASSALLAGLAALGLSRRLHR